MTAFMVSKKYIHTHQTSTLTQDEVMVNTESGRKREELQVLLKDYQNQLTSESPDNLRSWENDLKG